MALVMILAGSVLGTLSAVTGWTAFDMGFLQSVAVYLGVSVGFGLLGILASVAMSSASEQSTMGQFAG